MLDTARRRYGSTDCPARHGCRPRRVMDVDEFPHAVRVVYGGAAVCNLDVAPATMRVEGNEEIDSAVATVLVVVALALSPLSRNGLTHLADELDRGLVEADQRPLGIRRFSIEIEHVLHAGDVFAIDTGNAPHVSAPRLEIVVGQPAAHSLARQAVVFGEFDHASASSVSVQRPAFAIGGRLGAPSSPAGPLPCRSVCVPRSDAAPRSRPAPDCLPRSGAWSGRRRKG
ncbi:hypothetical protein AB7M49_004147 [Bradyrhizobium elkanii]